MTIDPSLGTQAIRPVDIKTLLAAMTLEQKAALTAGDDLWHTVAIPALGIPRLKVSDGPVGVRGDLTTRTTSVNFPCGSAVGATWNVELINRMGAALAEEARQKDVHVLLAPTVNLVRHPLAGRNFECMAEDPELTGRLASALIRGLQEAGVGACLKHYVANDQETERMSISSELDERTLREVYLRPFEAAVAEADPWTIMASYNKLNGTYATESVELLTTILKSEWGWDGAIISDWLATHSTAPAANAGLDLEMPGPAAWLGPHLAAAVLRGEVEESIVDQAALRLLGLLERAGRFVDPHEHPESSEPNAERAELAREISAESVVLLRNDDILPLKAAELSRVAVIGPASHPGFVQGGGSASVWPHRRLSPADAIRAALPDAEVTWSRGCAIGRNATPIHPDLLSDGGWRVSFWPTSTAQGSPSHINVWPEMRYSYFGRKIPGISNPFCVRLEAATEFTPDTSGAWTIELGCAGTTVLHVDGREVMSNSSNTPMGLIFAGDLETREVVVELQAGRTIQIRAELAVDTPGCVPHLYIGARAPQAESEIELAAQAAAAADAAIVFVGTGPEFESEGRDRETLSLPGAQDALVRAVLAAQPNTVVVLSIGAPVSLPWAQDAPAVLVNWFGGQESGAAIADVLFGLREPSGRLPMTFPYDVADSGAHATFPGSNGAVAYTEGLDIGHRWFARHNIAPAFPFGHGGSYTSFSFGSAEAIVHPDGTAVVRIPVTNIGAREGQEVIQIYVSGSDDAAPLQQLAGFAKVRVAPGQTASAEIAIPARAFARWNVEAHTWLIPSGQRRLSIATSATNIHATLEVHVGEHILTTPQI